MFNNCSSRTFFSSRVIGSWNSLPQHVIEATSVNAFKNRLDKHWSDMGIQSKSYKAHYHQVQVQVSKKEEQERRKRRKEKTEKEKEKDHPLISA